MGIGMNRLVGKKSWMRKIRKEVTLWSARKGGVLRLIFAGEWSREFACLSQNPKPLPYKEAQNTGTGQQEKV